MKHIKQILSNKKRGIDCTEDESAHIKAWLRETTIKPQDGSQQVLEDIQLLFPLEYGEYLDEAPAAPSTPLVDKQQESELRDKSLKWWVNLGHETASKLRDKYYPNRPYRPLLTADERLKIYLSEKYKQPESKQPLYKVLNSERGQGEWQHIERDNPETSRIPFGIIIPFHGACAPIFDTAAFPPNNAENIKRMKADAQYTALAVNNLHILAEALEACKSELYSIHSQYGDKQHALDNCDALKKAEQAIKNIS